MKELPAHNFFEGFYIWFDKDKKVEYYSTPLYLYNANFRPNNDERFSEVYIKECDFDGLKYPANLYFPYRESLGLMLTRFLNIDFNDFDAAYKMFFFAYGFEYIKDYAGLKELDKNYEKEDDLLEVMIKTFENAKYRLIDLQHDFRDAVDRIYNLNGYNELPSLSANAKFIASIVKHTSELWDCCYSTEVFLDNYSEKEETYQDENYYDLAKKIDSGEITVRKHHVYTSKKLSNIFYLILEQVVQVPNMPIKKCANCGKYFIPANRQDEIYCDFPDDMGRTCKEKGAGLTYKKTLETIPALLEYRRTYQKRIMIVSRNRDNPKLKKAFDKWKQKAQDKIKDYKSGKISEETLYKWMIANKDK